MTAVHPILCLLILPGMLISAGCKNKPPPVLFDVSGTVTFDGEPVPVGYVEFIPVNKKNGPGRASINDGRYEVYTNGKLKGLEPGYYDIRVYGFDGIAYLNEEKKIISEGTSLFPPHEMEKMIDFENTTLDIKIEYHGNQ